MQPRTATATATTATTTSNHSTSSCNNNNNNNLTTLAIMHRSTRTTTTTTTTARKTNSKFHKRRRRRQRSWQRSSRITTTKTTATATSTIRRTATTRRYSYPNLSRTGAYLTLLLLTTTCSLCASVSVSDSGSETSAVSSSASGSASAAANVGAFVAASSPCAPQHWWNQLQGQCTPCTSCQGDMILLRPCQLHIDTVCGSIYDLKIDWVVLAKTERNWKERRKSSEYEHVDQPTALQHLTHEQLQQLHEEAAAALPLDWQTGALFVAVLACLLFFSVAACILIHHMRQWRRMERRLDQDVEELSTKLMAKLAEVQSLDGGTFFIGNADALRALPASAVTAASAAQSGIFQPQHVLLPVEKHAKHQERRILKTLQPGNVYIEENNAVGLGGIISNFKG